MIASVFYLPEREEGSPQDIIKNKKSLTGHYLKTILR